MNKIEFDEKTVLKVGDKFTFKISKISKRGFSVTMQSIDNPNVDWDIATSILLPLYLDKKGE